MSANGLRALKISLAVCIAIEAAAVAVFMGWL